MLIDDPMFQFGYKVGMQESLAQIDRLIENPTARNGWETYQYYKKTIDPDSIPMFEQGWAVGSITIKAVVGHWLQTPKIHINYMEPIKDIVKEISEKYRFEMVPIDEEFEDEIKTAILFMDITRGKNGAVQH